MLQALAPTYEKLAKKFAGIDSVVIAKMDGTDNEHPAIDIKGFPTLLFFPAGEDKTPVVYSEGRDLKVGGSQLFPMQAAGDVPCSMQAQGVAASNRGPLAVLARAVGGCLP